MEIRRRAAIWWACCALLSGTGCSAQVSDEQRFAADMIRQIKQRLPGVDVARRDDPLSVSLKGGGRVESTINFHRIYGYCRNASVADCRSTREEFLDKVLRSPLPPVATAASLRIAVRDAEYIANARVGRPEPLSLVMEPIGEDLFALLVSDSPDAVATVPLDTLAKLGLTRQQAWARAWQQTRKALPALPSPSTMAQNPVLFTEQAYLASLLADTKAWHAIASAAGPELFVTVVADDMVFVARMPDGPRLEQFKQTVREDCASRPRCISPNLYRFRDGRWVVSR